MCHTRTVWAGFCPHVERLSSEPPVLLIRKPPVMNDEELKRYAPLDDSERQHPLPDGTGPDYEPASRLIETKRFPLADHLRADQHPIKLAEYDGWFSVRELRRFAESTMRIAHNPGRLVNGCDGDDVVSDVLLGLYERMESDNPPDVSTCEKLRGYLFRSVKYRAMDVGRSQKSKDARFRTVSAPWERDEDSELYWEPPAVAHVADRLPADVTTWVQTVLSPRERDVLDLAYQGYRNPEIAETLHISASSVRTVRERIRKKMQLAGVVDTSGLGSVVRSSGTDSSTSVALAAAA